ncbi:MAG TPA: hypothetical protein EYN67_13715 [Flavobacteriales bacterium]|nr:hypothetical protein [Flavobacteriales bacterium]
MSEITTSEILSLINERDKHTQDKFSDIAETQKEVAISLKKICDHIIVSEEDKKHDAEFKKEVRTHIKFADPILYKAQEHQADRRKVLIGVISFLILGVLGAFFKFS